MEARGQTGIFVYFLKVLLQWLVTLFLCRRLCGHVSLQSITAVHINVDSFMFFQLQSLVRAINSALCAVVPGGRKVAQIVSGDLTLAIPAYLVPSQ